jgi:hypothetical protein
MGRPLKRVLSLLVGKIAEKRDQVNEKLGRGDDGYKSSVILSGGESRC